MPLAPTHFERPRVFHGRPYAKVIVPQFEKRDLFFYIKGACCLYHQCGFFAQRGKSFKYPDHLDKHAIDTRFSLTHLLLIINASVNIIIYWFLGTQFREEFKRIFNISNLPARVSIRRRSQDKMETKSAQCVEMKNMSMTPSPEMI